MVWMSGTDKVPTFFNRGWLAFTGRTMEQEIGEGWLCCVHPDDLDHCLRTYSEAFDARTEFQFSIACDAPTENIAGWPPMRRRGWNLAGHFTAISVPVWISPTKSYPK